jgi:CheY-like chemotaxis protein
MTMLTDRVIPDKLKDSIRILVVEDNPVNQKHTALLLKSWGFRHDICANGKDAIRNIRVNKYDLILMDVEMPEMDGYETTVFIRNKLKLGLPIIATTAKVTEQDREKCLTTGMNDYIPKPINAEQLYNLVTNYLFSTVVENIENRVQN